MGRSKPKFSKKAGALFAVPDEKKFDGKTYGRETFNLGTKAKANKKAKDMRKKGRSARVVTGTLDSGKKGYFVYTRKRK